MAGVAIIDKSIEPKELKFSYSFGCEDVGSDAWRNATKQAINMGIQKTIGVNADGVFGSKSVAALATAINKDTITAVITHRETLESELARVEGQCLNPAPIYARPPRVIYESLQAPSFVPHYNPPQVGPQITPEQSRLMDSVRATGRGAAITGPIRGPLSIRPQGDGTTIIRNGEAAISVDQYGNKTPIDTPPTSSFPNLPRPVRRH